MSTEGMKKFLTPFFVPQPELNIVASFDRRGGRIVTGSSKGKVCLYCDSLWPSPIPMLSVSEVIPGSIYPPFSLVPRLSLNANYTHVESLVHFLT